MSECKSCGAPKAPDGFECHQCGTSYGVPRPAVGVIGGAGAGARARHSRTGLYVLAGAILLSLIVGGGWLAFGGRLNAPEVADGGVSAAEMASTDAGQDLSIQAGPPRIVVLPARTEARTYRVGEESLPAAALSALVQERVEERLIASNRFTVLDRRFSQEVLDEINRVDYASEDSFGALGVLSENIADLLVIPEIIRFEYLRSDRRLRTSDRVLSSYAGGAAIRLTVVNVGTGVVEFREAFDAAWPSTAPTTLGHSVDGNALVRSMSERLAGEAALGFIRRQFPVVAIALSDGIITLNQGEGSLQPSERYELVRLGDELTDPRTGRSLGREETQLGVVEITDVRSEVSLARFVDGGSVDASGFTPGSLELRERVTAQEAAAGGTPAVPQQQARETMSEADEANPVRPAALEGPSSDNDW